MIRGLQRAAMTAVGALAVGGSQTAFGQASPWSLRVGPVAVLFDGKASATGTLPALGGPSAKANLTLTPLLVHAGIGYRF